jgi:zinc transport system ATP-binding protein
MTSPAPARAAKAPHDHDHSHHDHAHHDHHHHVHPHGVQPFADDALVSARGLTLARQGRSVLEGIDFDIRAGEIVTVIGPNGAGKTTLVRVLLGLIKPDRGEIRRTPDLRLGYAPQQFNIDRTIPMTVERFLQLGLTRTTQPGGGDAIAGALAEVGAARVRGQQIASLSGGELQRVVLARALLREPQLLVLDEPVRGVDYAGEAELYDLIGQLRDRHGLGVLLVSHDLHIVMARSDRVVCINRHVCCSGVPQSVARDPEYARLFGPEAARAVAIYHHEHDHRHDLAGDAAPAATEKTGPR